MRTRVWYNEDMLKVGLDISQIAHPGGVANYTQNLALQLSDNKDLETVFFYSSFRKPIKTKLKNIKSFRLPPTLFEVLFNKIRSTNIEKFVGPIDIFHSSDWVQPPSKAKKVTTYHDMVPLKYPQWSHPKIVAVHKRRLKLVEDEIDMVIAVSESTKKDLMEVSNIPEEKITVIYEAADERYKLQEKKKVEDFRKRMNLPDKFILAIGGIGERRNLKRVKEAGKGYKLVITGQDIKPTDEEMPLLYSAANVLVYPSLYEGFGLPILESQACGTPVITSNISSMPEVAGKGAILVDPNSVKEITTALIELMDEGALSDKLIKDGFENVKRFSWEKCAKETVEVYRKVMNK
jgi:glycosyltransferase involved in cell wall biosynthesis